jgi:hypothetical protein
MRKKKKKSRELKKQKKEAEILKEKKNYLFIFFF